ncbi:MAG: hypothetical protein RI907_2600 [Pseudomonadota bacterium]|jgi:sensor histidine kinase YesM
MFEPATPYPPNLTRLRVLPRLFVLNQILLVVGALSLEATAALSPAPTAGVNLLYYWVWLQCVGLISWLITANAMLAVARQGWRHMPEAHLCYRRAGLYRSLPWRSKALMVLTTVACVWLSAWLAQALFIDIQGTTWGLAHLAQARPAFKMTLFNACYGTFMIYVFEYFHDRAAVAETRARLAQQLSDEAQLKLLRSQLDPHMLFNTLSNLYELIDDCPQQAKAMLLNLIGFLRSTLQGSRATRHALEEEFKLAADYLALMQIRLGDRLQARLELPAALRQALVPAMLLQPLIENAIKHGIEARKQGGDLHVQASTQGDQLLLTVSNAGGAHPRRAHQAAPRMAEDGGGFGLQHVQDRLQALYGDLARFELQHRADIDTTLVTLSLPLQHAGHPSP